MYSLEGTLTDVQKAMDALIQIHSDEVAALLRDDFDRIAELKATL